MVFPSRQPASGAVDLSTVVLRDGSQAFTASQSMGGFKLTSLGAPSAVDDAATKGYVDGVAGGVSPGANGTVFATAAGVTGWVGPGSEAQPLLSNGTGAPYFGATTAVLTQRVRNDLNTAVSVGARVLHELATTVGAIGVGVRLEFVVTNGSADNAPIAAIDAVALGVAGDAEVGALDFVVANGGGAVDTPALRVGATSLSTYTGTAWVPLFSRTLGEWLYGSDDAANGGNAVLLAPSSGAGLYLRRGSTNHIAVNSAGATTIGTVAHTTAVQGTSVTLAGTSGLQIGSGAVVTVYVGGARVPEITITALSGGSTHALDASHEVVFVDTTAGIATLTLPAGASGRPLAIQRIAGANNVVVERAGADTLRVGGTGALTSWTINDEARHSLIFRSAGTEWAAEA